MLTRKRLPFFIALIFGLEISIFLWSFWTSTFNEGNYFAIKSEFIFDKCARLAGRISSVLLLTNLLMAGYSGFKIIFVDDKKRDSFMTFLTLFTFNHLIHLLFVILRFQSHGESITLFEPISIGGTLHGFITFSFIILFPFILWKINYLNKFFYWAIILHLLNISCFIVKTFLSKINYPDHPAYQNQLGVVLIIVACLYLLYRVYRENRENMLQND